MRAYVRVVWVVALLLIVGSARAQDAAGCRLHKDVYRCNWAEFLQVLDAAHTVWVPVDPMDRFTGVQLRRLVGALGKTVSAEKQHADLEMDVVPAPTHGVTIGPADRALATLRVFARSGADSRPTLVWAETFRGQPDRPWASSVHSAILQFKARMGAR